MISWLNSVCGEIIVRGYGEMRMIQIKRDSFYSRSELVKVFGEQGVDWDALSARMRVPRRHRLLFYGQDILDSWMSLPDQREKSVEAPQNSLKPKRIVKCRRGLEEASEGLVAGVWTPQEVGL